jgi:hypothetical protein
LNVFIAQKLNFTPAAIRFIAWLEPHGAHRALYRTKGRTMDTMRTKAVSQGECRLCLAQAKGASYNAGIEH